MGGDAGARGVPVLRVRPAQATAFGPELLAPADRLGRVFNPQVAFTGDGHPMLLYQEKTHEAGFSRAAPLKAAIATADRTALAAPTVVTSDEIAQPRVAALAAAGRYAAFIWGGGGKHGYVRISVRGF
jgi:hypothetical protein